MSNIKITGAKEIVKELQNLEKKLAKKLIRQEMRKAIKITAEETKVQAPVDEGDLAKAVKVRAAKGKRGTIGVRVVIDEKSFPDQFYGSFVEFGTSRQEPNPFMRRAYDLTAQRVADTFTRGLWEAIKKEL